MNTCGTCKFRGDEGDGVPAGYFLCTLIEQRIHGETQHPPACVVDGSDYYAALCVENEFGCNLWQPK